MSDLEKKRFVQMSESDQTRLDKEMVIFNEKKKTQIEEKKAEKIEENKKKKEEQKAEKRKAVEVKKAEKDAEKLRLQEEKKAAKKKMKKDPNAPKGPKTSYMMFFTEYREKLKAEQPGLSITEMAKEGGKKWKEMTPSQRAKFEKKAADDKIRYEREKQAYQSGSGSQTIPELFKKSGTTPSKNSAVVTNGCNVSSSSDSSSDSDSDSD